MTCSSIRAALAAGVKSQRHHHVSQLNVLNTTLFD